MSYDHNAGRADLIAFAEEQPDNFWRADSPLRRLVGRWAGSAQAARWEAEFDRFGAESAGPLDAAVRRNNLAEHLPRLNRWGPYGERIEAVEHHPDYHRAGRLIYGSGVMAVLGEPGNNLRSLILFFLSALNGEAGHNCPLACTAGVIKSLLALGSAELKARYLPRLLSRDYDRLAHGAQFLTEIQGGSDVGANAVRAVPAEAPGGWRIFGEKWFCSNATADLILMTARPDGAPAGTRGLGLFLVPRRLPDDRLNDYALRRLKDKLGTRSMASAEIDFQGAFAWSLGPLEQGFKNMLTYVLTPSRLYNAFSTSANARRACYVAHGYARRRRAFGPRIIEYPMVQETLADMRSETAAMISGSGYLAHLLDRIERNEATAAERGFFRLAINLTKLRSAQSAHEVILSGIEVLGGNGAIESFSVLPRLLRDNVVAENWEGTHNVLLLQVLRDCRRLGCQQPFMDTLAEQSRGHPRLSEAVAAAGAELAAVLQSEEECAGLQMRPLGARLAWLHWAATMHQDGSDPLLIEHFLDRRIGPPAPRNPSYRRRLERLTAEP